MKFKSKWLHCMLSTTCPSQAPVPPHPAWALPGATFLPAAPLGLCCLEKACVSRFHSPLSTWLSGAVTVLSADHTSVLPAGLCQEGASGERAGKEKRTLLFPMCSSHLSASGRGLCLTWRRPLLGSSCSGSSGLLGLGFVCFCFSDSQSQPYHAP